MVKLMQPQNQERVILDNVLGVAEVAYDWVARNLYFVDRVRGQIGICSLGGNLAYCTQLLPSRARAIAVHPGHSMLFYAEGGSDGGRLNERSSTEAEVSEIFPNLRIQKFVEKSS